MINGKSTNGGAIVNEGNLSIVDCIFEKNYATSYNGGGAICSTSGNLTVFNSKFNNNSAPSGYGGAIRSGSTLVNISNSSFTNNYAKYSGAVALNNASIINSYFANNYAVTNYGGSISIIGSLINNTIINSKVNSTSGRGGAVYLSGNSYLKNNTMIDCSAGVGQYIYLSGAFNANITFNDVTITTPTGTVNATVTDDLGHPVYGGTLSFYAGNESLGSASVKDGMATVTYTKLLKNNGLCNLTGESASFTDLSNIKNSTLTVNIDRTPKEVYVSTTGSDDTGDGSVSKPYLTISKAIHEAFSTSYYPIVHILEGTYSGDGNTNMSFTDIGVLNLIGETYNKTVIDGENQSGIFNFGQYTQVILKNLTFQNVTSTGAVSANSDFNIDSCIFNNCGSAVSGSAIDTVKILKNSVFNNACSSISGNDGNYAIISNCSFSNGLYTSLWGSYLNVSNCKFSNNTAYRDGGAIYSQGNLISTNNQYINNSAINSESNFGNGGAIYCSGSSYVQSVNDTFIGNKASRYGGAIYVGFGANSGATLVVINGTFTKNSAGTCGGTIYAYANPDYGMKNITLINNTMDLNSAVTNGNDIYLDGSSLITGSNLTFVGNGTVNISKLAGDLTATVTDDNGNSVSGGSVSFYLNGEYIGQANVINGVATLNYIGFKNGAYNLTGTSSNAADPVYTKNGVVKVAISNEKDSVEYYVSKSGNDSTGNGTVSNPFLTIQKALNTGFELSRNIIIHLLEGTYSGAGNTNITLPGTMNITIIGDGVNKTIIDGESTTNWIFNITLGKGLITLDSLSLINSKSNTASPIMIDNTSVKILNSYFGNNTGFNGGAINNQGKLTINNTTFYGNKAISISAGNYGGGAIFNTGTLIINSTSLLNNAATTGTGIFNGGNLSISDSLIGNNTKSTWANMGSAIYGGNVSVVKCTFTNNTGSGNNYDISGTVFLEIYNSTFYNLTMGIGSLAKIYNSLFTNMTSTLYLNGEIYNSIFCNISLISFTGEIYNSTFFNSSFSCSNTEIYNSSFANMKNAITVTGGDLIVVGSLFDNNTCAISGSGNNVNISNCVILNPVQLTASNLTADYNWWGNNTKPVITGGNINYWLVITLTPDNKPGLNRNITLTFKSTDGEKIYTFDGYLPVRDYVFSVSDGTISPVSGSLTDNAANAVFNAGTYGNYSVNATIDNQTLTCNFELYQADTATTVDLSNSTSKQGNKIVITANVKDEKSGDPVGEGEVEFFIGNTSIGKAAVHDGKATKEWVIDKDRGVYEINVQYLGSESYLTSDNHAFLTVTSVNTTTNVNLSNSSVKYGDRVNVTAVVKETASGNVVNGGVVKFYRGSTLIGTADLVNGIATLKNWIADLTVGQYNITAQYMGLGDYLASQAQSTLNEVFYNGTTWNIYNYLNNTQIQYILNNCVNNSNIVFNGGQYNNLTLTISKPVNVKNNGTVTIVGNGSGTVFTVNANATIQGLIIKNYS
ncbi:beta strand repeat-containing protein, partial [Methanobacterium bryantii]|uniref:beta strand repeat-containing protein n=1 Tax=Methanobacterium bryantii TaxID=2161 RepID=UPI0015CD75ED